MTNERGRLAGFHRPLLAATHGQQRARARAEQPLRYGKPTALMTDRVTVRPRPLRYLHKHHTVTAPSKSEGRASEVRGPLSATEEEGAPAHQQASVNL